MRKKEKSCFWKAKEYFGITVGKGQSKNYGRNWYKSGLLIISFVLVFLSFWESLVLPFKFFNNSYRLILLLSTLGILGVALVTEKEILVKFLNNSRLTLFLGLILISIISFWWSPELKNSFNAILVLLEALGLYVFFILLSEQNIIKLDRIINWWLIFVLINFILGIWLYVGRESWSQVMSLFFGEETTKAYLLEILRGRIVPIGSIYNIFLLGSIKIFGEKNKNSERFGWIILSVGLISLILSNYRSMVIVSLFGIIGIIFIFRKKFKREVLKLGVFTLGMILLVILGSKIFFDSSVGDRFLMRSTGDKNSIISRWGYAIQSWNMFLEKPLEGISIGNFPYLSKSMDIYTAKGVKLGELPGQTHSQLLSWLVETGIGGFMIFVILVVNFIIFDLKNYLAKKYNTKVIVIMIVGYVYLLGSFVDAYPTYGWLTFWIIRGMIEGNCYEK